MRHHFRHPQAMFNKGSLFYSHCGFNLQSYRELRVLPQSKTCSYWHLGQATIWQNPPDHCPRLQTLHVPMLLLAKLDLKIWEKRKKLINILYFLHIFSRHYTISENFFGRNVTAIPCQCQWQLFSWGQVLSFEQCSHNDFVQFDFFRLFSGTSKNCDLKLKKISFNNTKMLDDRSQRSTDCSQHSAVRSQQSTLHWVLTAKHSADR
jgi:hypothetical protein